MEAKQAGPLALAFMATYIVAYVLPKEGLLPIDPMAVVLQQPLKRMWVGCFIKALPIVLLAACCHAGISKAKTEGSAAYARYIAFGLGLGSLGDVFLDMNDIFPATFLPGLISFFMGHTWYIWAFATQPIAHSAAVAVPFLVLPGAVYAYLFPSLPSDMVVPVAVYCTAISLMGYYAAVRATKCTGSFFWTLAGALIFLLSDSILAVGRFKTPLPFTKLWVMLTYYAAQWCMFKGLFAFLKWEEQQEAAARGKKGDGESSKKGGKAGSKKAAAVKDKEADAPAAAAAAGTGAAASSPAPAPASQKAEGSAPSSSADKQTRKRK